MDGPMQAGAVDHGGVEGDGVAQILLRSSTMFDDKRLAHRDVEGIDRCPETGSGR